MELEILRIEAGKSTPKVVLDNDNNMFIIEGQSYPENSSSFYEPVINWIKNYLKHELVELILDLKLLYINTSSTKAMFYLFDILEGAYEEGKNIKIIWKYDAENEMAKETGEELLEDLNVPYSIVQV